MMIHDLSGAVVDTEQDEDKPNIIFVQELGFMAKLQITPHCLFLDLSMHMLLPFKTIIK